MGKGKINMSVIELLEPIKTKIVGKEVEELLNKVENNTFIIVKGVIGSGQEFSMQVISERTNRQCVSIDIDYLNEFKDIDLLSVLSDFADTDIAKSKDLIFVIKRNTTIADDLERIQEINKIFEQTIFNKINAVVFYMILEKNMQ